MSLLHSAVNFKKVHSRTPNMVPSRNSRGRMATTN
ncbi:uncharacterized protein G2W53_011693 [Senna tora]|uniref:Uncharacterized protein n=1 Tax=Senna tora TaxID=362788 RepID=A0A835CBH7_9FABA|nr:uncharacterized protein G2W53_011693 [Senna tora]